MANYGVVAQPLNSIEYRSLLETALSHGKVSTLAAAVAYATYGGVECLLELLEAEAADSWDKMAKRWLVGIDWMRSEPAALDLLSGLKSSTVRIHDGLAVVGRAGCTPRLPYHPKIYLLHGGGYDSAVIGSGNLSKNGLSRGHEVGVAITVGKGASESAARLQFKSLSQWFDGLWNAAPSWQAVRGDYLRVYKSKRNFAALVPTDDDSADSAAIRLNASSRGFSPEQLRQLRAADNFWIDGGKLTNNRGTAHPGNQLMMRRFTRVFFGFEARDLDRNSDVGSVSIKYGSHVREVSPIRFSDNAMDVITLPLTGAGGPPTYDHRVLHFKRTGVWRFDLDVRPRANLSSFQTRSRELGANFKMSSGRTFGVY